MRKSTLFISATSTAFILAVLFGVVSAYRNITGVGIQPTQVAVVQPALPTPIPAATEIAMPVQPTNITPQQAADIASKIMGRTDLYSVELTQLEGIDAYLVTFSSGDLVYVGLDGQILAIAKLPVTVVQLPKNGGHNNSRSGGEHEGEHEGDDD
jgi:hypothetical protein